ncbi:MAG TPA: hypothetical protein VND19_24650 [Acetobacteraceae bacterium]|nr:hypothetical protein [Acetobacteraceae bacterium]
MMRSEQRILTTHTCSLPRPPELARGYHRRNRGQAVDQREIDVLAGDQLLVAGVIDTLTNLVEHPEVVADRIRRVAEVVGDPRRVLAATDCGFDASAGLGRVASDVVWAKPASSAEGARLASQRLF